MRCHRGEDGASEIRIGVLESWPAAVGGGDELTGPCGQIYLTSSCLINPDRERVESGRLRGKRL